jgi:hypothetical protein
MYSSEKKGGVEENIENTEFPELFPHLSTGFPQRVAIPCD